MSINVKKYTKDQMAKMVEDSQAEAQELKRVNAALTEQIDQMNGEAINKANEIEKLKADADALQNKLADTEAALGMANAEADRNASALKRLHIELCNAAQRANYAEWHPWLNLWAWVKRELGYAK
jgi:predicted  nucleic acid-binding Zn-ribbon protein